METPLVNTKLLVRIGIGFVIALVAIWIIGYAKKMFSSTGNGSSSGLGGMDQNGNPATPGGIGVDSAYINRIATLAQKVHESKDFTGISSERCELINNLVGMRDEEVLALIAACNQLGFALKADVDQYKSDGCIDWFGTSEKIKDAQNRLKNF